MQLWLLRLGTIRENDGPVPAYLLKLNDGRHILIDTGLPRDLAGQAEGIFAVEPDQHVVAAPRPGSYYSPATPSRITS